MSGRWVVPAWTGPDSPQGPVRLPDVGVNGVWPAGEMPGVRTAYDRKVNHAEAAEPAEAAAAEAAELPAAAEPVGTEAGEVSRPVWPPAGPGPG